MKNSTLSQNIASARAFKIFSFILLVSSFSDVWAARPKISSQPASVAVFAGQLAKFSVSVSGASTLTYQWRKNGVNIAGAQSSTYSIASSSLSDAGAYSVSILANSTRLVSNNAQLSVSVAPPNSAADNAWYDKNLLDPSILEQVKALGADGSLNRNDMISVLRSAGSTTDVIDAQALADLRLLVSNGAALNMPAHVINLSGKVVNYNVANARYQGLVLGNLAAGDSWSKLDRLVSKWFLGSDLPEARNYDGTDLGGTTIFPYVNASSPLINNGQSVSDVKQGRISNCYMHAAIGAVVSRNPSLISANFIDNSDGTYTVRFFNGSSQQFVTINRQLPVSGSQLIYANVSQAPNSSTVDIWEALLEKAYAQINEEAWIGQSGMNSYQGLNFGSSAVAFRHMTGKSTTSGTPTQSVINNDLALSKMMSLSTKSTGTEVGIDANHVYTMIRYDSATALYTLYNPLGHYISLSWTQIANNYTSYVSGQ